MGDGLIHKDEEPLLPHASSVSRAKGVTRRTGELLLLLALSITAAVAMHEHLGRRLSSQDVPLNRLQWFRCPDLPSYQCAFFEVPLDYTNPDDSDTISLALRKYPARAPKHLQRGPLLVNPGGPGGSGTSFIAGYSEKLSIVLSGAYDLISFDPRGVNMTTPSLNCYSNQAYAALAQWSSGWGMNAHSFVNTMLGSIGSEGQMPTLEMVQLRHIEAAMEAGNRQCDAFGNTKLFRAVNTAFVARDMASLLDALGHHHLNYWGFSYGTILGATFAAMFPDRVGRMVLDGVSDAEYYHTNKWDWGRAGMTDSNAVLAGLLASCADAGPARCAFAKAPSDSDGQSQTGKTLRQRYDAFEAHLVQHPLSFHSWKYGSGVVTASMLRHATFLALYKPASWPRFARALFDAEAGDGEGLYDIAMGRMMDDFQLREAEDNVFHRHLETIGMLSTVAIMCGDSQGMGNRTQTEDPMSYIRELRNISITGEIWALWILQCLYWRKRPFEVYHGPWSRKAGLRRTHHPMLLIGNTADPVTPLSSAHKMAQLFGSDSAVVLTQDGFGHCSIAHPSLCTAKRIRSYFQDGALPPVNTTCVADEGFLYPDVRKSVTIHASAEDQRLADAWRDMNGLDIGQAPSQRRFGGIAS